MPFYLIMRMFSFQYHGKNLKILSKKICIDYLLL